MIDKLIICVLLLIILVLCNQIINHKEYYQNVCPYVPWGPSIEFCKNNCLNFSKKHKQDSCDENSCEDKCINCELNDDCMENPDNCRCEWVNVWTNNQRNQLLYPNKQENNYLPSKLNISHFYDKNKNILTLTWVNNNDSTKYVINYYSINNKGNVTVLELEQTTDNTINYVFTNLKKGEEFIFYVYAVNKYGMSEISNIVNFTT